MTTFLRWMGLLFVVLVCQSTWVSEIRIGRISPDLAFGLVFALSLRYGMRGGVWGGFALGLLIDLEEPERLGLHSLAYVLSAMAVDRWSRAFDRSNPLVLFVLFLVTALVSETVRMAWLGWGSPRSLLGLVFGVGWPSAVYTALIVPPLSWGVAKVFGYREWVLRAS